MVEGARDLSFVVEGMGDALVKVVFGTTTVHVIVLDLELADVDMEGLGVIKTPAVFRLLNGDLVEVTSVVAVEVVHLVGQVMTI